MHGAVVDAVVVEHLKRKEKLEISPHSERNKTHSAVSILAFGKLESENERANTSEYVGKDAALVERWGIANCREADNVSDSHQFPLQFVYH